MRFFQVQLFRKVVIHLGRNKQTLQVLQGKGATHLTKEEITARRAQEERMRGSSDKVEPPEHLLAKQKKEFDFISSQLIDLGIFSNLDVDGLSRYIEAKSEYARVSAAIRKLDPLKSMDDYAKLNRVRKSLSDECRSYASDLGLTITSRLKLVMPEAKEKEQKTPGEKRFGGRL